MIEKGVNSDFVSSSPDEPMLGVFDFGLQNLMIPSYEIDEYGAEENNKYRQFDLVAFSPVKISFPGRAVTKELAEAGEKTFYANTELSVQFTNDYEYFLPRYIHHSRHVPIFTAIDPARLGKSYESAVGVQSDGSQIANHILNNLTFERESLPTYIVGEDTIVEFLKGYMSLTEADKEKTMPYRTFDYVLPRVDSDLLAFNVGAKIAGVETDRLAIPEEHRLRVLQNLAFVMSYEMQSPSALDDNLEIQQGRPPDAPLEAMLTDPGYIADAFSDRSATSLGHIVEAYRFSFNELAESIEIIWQAHSQWFDEFIDSPVKHTYDALNVPPDMRYAEKFKREVDDPQKLKFYSASVRKMIRHCVSLSKFESDGI